MNKLKFFIINHWPYIFIVAVAFLLYTPYLFGLSINMSSGAMARYSVWDHFFKADLGWYDFFRNGGLFLGGDANFGWFNPLFYVIRLLGSIFFLSSSLAETLLTFFYFSFLWIVSYLFLRKLKFKKWIALLCSGFFVFNGLVAKDDTNTSLGFALILPFPLLMLISWDGLAGKIKKIVFVLAVFFSLSYGHPQMVFWALALVFFYFLFFRSRKDIFNLLALTLAGILLSLPQLLLTMAMLKHDLQNLLATSPYVSGNGLGVMDLLRGFAPFLSMPKNYINSFLYLNPLAYLLLFYGAWLTIKNFKKLPKWLIFFSLVGLLALATSLAGSPLQLIIARLPVIGSFIARSPFRYLAIFYFCLSVFIAHWLDFLIVQHDKLRNFLKIIFWFGIIAVSGYLLVTILVVLPLGQEFLAEFKNKFLNSFTGVYPTDYYVSLFDYYLSQLIGRFSFLNWHGWILALPFILMTVGYWLIKKTGVKYIAVYFLICLLGGGAVFGLIIGQESSFYQSNYQTSENSDFSSYAYKNYSNLNQSYVLAYDRSYLADYYSLNYLNGYAINNWLKRNYLTVSQINYNNPPNLRNFTNPFIPFRQSLIATYLGLPYGLNEEADFSSKIKGSAAFLNGDLKGKTTEDIIGLRLNFLRQIGVKFIILPEEMRLNGLKKIKEFIMLPKGVLRENFQARAYAYQLEEPGSIIYAPELINQTAFDFSDSFNLLETRQVFDQLNQNSLSLIEIPSYEELPRIIKQNPAGYSLDNIHFSANKISFRLDALESGWLIINLNYLPGWLARINSQPALVGRANLNYLAVKVGTGFQEVELEFSGLIMAGYSLWPALFKSY